MGDSNMAYVLRERVVTRPRPLEIERPIERPVERIGIGIRPPLPGEVVRQELKRAIADVWNTPEGMELRDELSIMAKEYGKALKEFYKTRGIADSIRALAERYKLGQKYRMAWGKE